VSYSFLELNII